MGRADYSSFDSGRIEDIEALVEAMKLVVDSSKIIIETVEAITGNIRTIDVIALNDAVDTVNNAVVALDTVVDNVDALVTDMRGDEIASILNVNGVSIADEINTLFTENVAYFLDNDGGGSKTDLTIREYVVNAPGTINILVEGSVTRRGGFISGSITGYKLYVNDVIEYEYKPSLSFNDGTSHDLEINYDLSLAKGDIVRIDFDFHDGDFEYFLDDITFRGTIESDIVVEV